MVRPLLLCLAALLLLPACPAPGDAPASAYLIERRDQAVGGPSASAREGDYILENGLVRAGVLSDRCTGEGIERICTSPGPGLFGGSMIDIDLQRTDALHSGGHGLDQFAEMFSAVNLDVTATESVEILADGSDGGPAIIRVQGPPGNYISYIGLLGNILGLAEGWHITDWILEPGDPYVTIRTTFVVMEDADVAPPDPCGWSPGDEGLPCDEFLLDNDFHRTVEALNSGATQFGDFFFAGGDVDIFLPGIGFQEDKAVVDALVGGNNPFVDPFRLPFVAATGKGVSYALGNGTDLAAPIFTSSLTAVYGAAYVPEVDDEGDPIQPEPGAVFTYERYLGVGDGDVGSAVESLLAAYGERNIGFEQARLEGQVVEETTMRGLSGVDVLVFQDTDERDANGMPPKSALFTQWTTDAGYDGIPDGSYGGRIPAGEYLLVVNDTSRGPSDPVRVSVPGASIVEQGLIAPRGGTLEVAILDTEGRDLPAKVSLRPLDPSMAASLPDLGDPYIAGGISRVVFAPSGHAEIEVPVGRYDVIVTRGIEYSIWNSANEGWPDGVVVGPGLRSQLDPVLFREVDSTGFIAADLHVHAVSSHDSGVPLDVRVGTMVSEGVEFLSSTDHDYIVDYRPVIELMGLDPWLAATVGLETTTIEIGHYLGFPFAHDLDSESGGALDWTGKTPTQILAGLRDLSLYGPDDAMIYVGHPRDGILGYFDQYGLNPFEGSRLNPELESSLLNLSNPMLDPLNFTLDFDALELLNGKRFDFIRTPTQEEIDCQKSFLDGAPLPGCEAGVEMYDIIARTMDEQEALEDLDEPFFLTTDVEGQIDDWFTLLNLGYRHTALGNSDTHGLTGTESGCPRNYVVSDVDEPELLDERDVARAIKEHRVVASYGPLIRLTADGHGIGSEYSSETGTVVLAIEVQAPRWMLVDRVEVYENGALVAEFTGDALDPDGVIKFEGEFAFAPRDASGNPQDAWYVVAAMGPDDLSPLFTPVAVPKLQLNDIVVGALGEIDLGSLSSAVASEGPAMPRTYPVMPYAITNPIWVDVNGGDLDLDSRPFDALGYVPEWFRPAPDEE